MIYETNEQLISSILLLSYHPEEPNYSQRLVSLSYSKFQQNSTYLCGLIIILQLYSHVYQRFHKVRPEALEMKRSTSLSQNTPSKSAAYTLYDS